MPPSGQPAGGAEKRCTHCGSSHTTVHWRNHPTSGQSLCNACRKYADRNRGQLPPDSVLQRRPAQPRLMADVRKEMSQRRCLQCGSGSPGRGVRACWHRHPATGEEWLCWPCSGRIYKQLKRQQRQEIVSTLDAEAEAEGEQPSGHSSSEADAAEGEQALQPLGPQPPPVSRKRRQERRGAEGKAHTFHDDPDAAAKMRVDGRGQLAASSGGDRAAAAVQEAAPWREPASQPAAQRRQQRKQAQPQHLSAQQHQHQHQPERQPSLAPTVLAKGAAEAAGSEGQAVASLHGAHAAAGEATLAAGTAAGAGVGDAAAAAASLGNQQPEAEQDSLDLLQQAMEVAAAAAAGLAPELVAAFAALLPLRNNGQVG